MAATISWFMLDGVLAAITPAGSFALGDSGWVPSNTADVHANGREISEEAARAGWGDGMERFGSPPIMRLSERS